MVKPSNYISNNNILNNNNDKYDKYTGLEEFEFFNGEKIRHNPLTELLISLVGIGYIFREDLLKFKRNIYPVHSVMKSKEIEENHNEKILIIQILIKS